MGKVNHEKLIADYKADCQLRDMTYHSIRSYVSEIKIFSEFLKKHNYDILKINNNVLEHFLEYLQKERKVSKSRIENYFSALSSFYDYLLYKETVSKNIILPFRKRFIRSFKKGASPQTRKLISVDEMKNFINSIIPIRDKAIALLFAKTGIRRGELLGIEVDDIVWNEKKIILKPRHKRTNCIVFFDEETEYILKKWVKQREQLVNNGVTALFVSDYGTELKRSGVYNAVTRWAKKLGYYNTDSDKLKDHFSCHNFRHWFTTHLIRNGMPREYVKELRGDIRSEAIDIYHHIDERELKKSYLSSIPKLDII
jgi:integrase/recombinase XerD